MNCLYILQEREFKNLNAPIYKIGKTTQKIETRVRQYPKGSILHYFNQCVNCHSAEKEVIRIFKEKYKHKKEYGNEYFEGDIQLMIIDMDEIIKNQRIEYSQISEEVSFKRKSLEDIVKYSFDIIFPNYEKKTILK